MIFGTNKDNLDNTTTTAEAKSESGSRIREAFLCIQFKNDYDRPALAPLPLGGSHPESPWRWEDETLLLASNTINIIKYQ